ncbi:hypothetical protein PFICI_03676 [Pestalotiopsis fici W106-1]|uniref:MARVEL domain-containing protein n=1 Tax=Pestalotiopsis fici (strain W106-1 / CGMCC3.15140) TaxID=1229662 RepID=W3XK88_PESFW|nr:uncharacterized protein PFICI_03676 [Pestalotiopsis fici W106-1]ETS85651.1 hypothetical protein PFICI_03676 [Pestalotiopsis fici W106-1]
MLSIVTIGVRVFALLFGAVVLGLSVTLAKQQHEGKPPSETSFGSFTGAFGIIASGIGLFALWFDKISPLVTMIIDALASIFYLAGGISLVLALKSVKSCTGKDAVSEVTRFTNKILNGGCTTKNGQLWCYVGSDADNDGIHPDLIGRCQRAQADYVFEFLGFIVGLALITLGFLAWRRGGSRTRAYA